MIMDSHQPTPPLQMADGNMPIPKDANPLTGIKLELNKYSHREKFNLLLALRAAKTCPPKNQASGL